MDLLYLRASVASPRWRGRAGRRRPQCLILLYYSMLYINTNADTNSNTTTNTNTTNTTTTTTNNNNNTPSPPTKSFPTKSP